MKGTVKSFNAKRGYGFITGEDGNEYFAHYSEIQSEGFKKLKTGSDVSFEPGSSEKGNIAKTITEM